MTALEALLKELEERANASTSEPWEYSFEGMMAPPAVFSNSIKIAEVISGDNNAQFVAALNPVTVKKLIAVIRALKDPIEGLAKGVDWNNGTHAKVYRPKLLSALEDCEKIVRAENENKIFKG